MYCESFAAGERARPAWNLREGRPVGNCQGPIVGSESTVPALFERPTPTRSVEVRRARAVSIRPKSKA